MIIEDKDYTFRFRMYMQANGLKVGDSTKFYQFLAWMSEMWSKFRKSKGLKKNAPMTKKMHAEFDSWLEVEVAKN